MKILIFLQLMVIAVLLIFVLLKLDTIIELLTK